MVKWRRVQKANIEIRVGCSAGEDGEEFNMQANIRK
jgi:hypothetical protein